MSEVSLKEHFGKLLNEQDRRIEQAQAAAKEALQKAEFSIDKHRELLREFRADVEGSNYIREDQLKNLLERISILERSRDYAYGGIFVVAMIGVINLLQWLFGYAS